MVPEINSDILAHEIDLGDWNLGEGEEWIPDFGTVAQPISEPSNLAKQFERVGKLEEGVIWETRGELYVPINAPPNLEIPIFAKNYAAQSTLWTEKNLLQMADDSERYVTEVNSRYRTVLPEKIPKIFNEPPQVWS